jgi:chromosome segregation ATPase
MARGGVNKAVVQKAREALLARGENPTIDAIRVELGNTGSKTTIHRYLKEIEARDPRPGASRERLSDELSRLVAAMLDRLMEEGGEAIDCAQAQFDAQKAALEANLGSVNAELGLLKRQFDSQNVALEAQSQEQQTLNTSLQSELTRNARLSQQCSDLEVRLAEKDEQIRSLEEKHLHARDALEHYRNAIKTQREQEQRRHEDQLKQLQVEMRQLQQTLIIKQDDLTRLNRDNERLLGESRQQARELGAKEDVVQRLTGEIQNLRIVAAKAEGAKEQLQDQLSLLRKEAKELGEKAAMANDRADEVERLLAQTKAESERLHHRDDQEQSSGEGTEQ